MTSESGKTHPLREVRAVFDEKTLVVYQAYAPRIADPAVAAGTFVSPFKIDRMTWIKPSFLWMMYRSGWATKPDQERVLAISISRAGFEQALTEACLSHYEASAHGSHDDWLERKRTSPVRVQWDPERDLRGEPLAWRAIQVGLGPSAARRYVSDWITDIIDVTPTVRSLAELIDQGKDNEARAGLPVETPYPLPPAVARNLGASSGPDPD